ncbi:MAG: Holliday junction resolvase RecU [Bacilli bacterium]|nr:Holliday junction resolvase RecU [Bacilli bacterium]
MKYPSGIKLNTTKNITYNNRGMNLEADINITNQYYIDNNIAFIYKKPTPIQVTKVDYSRNNALIKEAYFKEPSTTDYNGLYKGKYIDFEAKETESRTAFPLSNIHNHQIKHLENIINHDGIGFIIIRFNKLNKTFLLLAIDLVNFIKNNDRKSIPLNYFEKKAYLIEEKYIPRVDYLKIIDLIYGGMKNEIKKK